jgi:hypothetical protein
MIHFVLRSGRAPRHSGGKARVGFRRRRCGKPEIPVVSKRNVMHELEGHLTQSIEGAKQI